MIFIQCYICDKTMHNNQNNVCKRCAKSYELIQPKVIEEAILVVEPNLTAQEAQLDLLPDPPKFAIRYFDKDGLPVDLGGF